MDPSPVNYNNLKCCYNYNSKHYSKKDFQIPKLDILKLFKNIVKDDQLYYFMKTISTFLIQNNVDEKAIFWLGKGRNGKKQ